MNRPSAVTRMLDGKSDRQSSPSLLAGRPKGWMFALWSGYIATWAIVSDSSPLVVAAWWLAGICLMQAITGRDVRPDATHGNPVTRTDDAPAARVAPVGVAVQDWESEGGAIA